MASRVPTPRSIVKTPSALTVEYARMRLRSVSCTDRYAPTTIVTAPTAVTAPVHSVVAPRIGVILAMRYTPALTIVAECRYALTGVGAAIAFGNQKWNGTCADFVNAANNTNVAMAS